MNKFRIRKEVNYCGYDDYYLEYLQDGNWHTVPSSCQSNLEWCKSSMVEYIKEHSKRKKEYIYYNDKGEIV